MNRTDPFFTTTLPHKRPFLESMHRTYSNALPKRHEEGFARAIQFREREKQRYRGVEMENEQLRSKLEEMTAHLKEADEIHRLWKELSKAGAKVQRNGRSSGSESVHTGASDGDGRTDGVGASANASSGAGSGSQSARDDEASGAEVGRPADESGREVRPTDVDDARGPPSEHAPEGSERGGGAGESPGEEPQGTVRDHKA